MRILSVKLENFKSWTHAEIPFTEGVNAIVGHNGAGKSSILDAIGLALFDYPSRNERSALARQGIKSGAVTVVIESNLDGRLYEVVRRTSGDWQIRDVELGARLYAGIPDVQAFLREHMGLSPTADLAQIFSDAVGVPQGKLTAVFLETPTRRKQVFGPLLEVAEYDTAWENLRDTMSLLRERVNETNVTIARLAGVLEQLPDVRQRLGALQGEIEKDKAALAQVETQLQAATRAREAWDAQRTELQTREQQEVRSQARLENSAQSVARATADLEEARRAQQIVTASKKGYEQHLHARTQRAALDADRARRQQLQLERAEIVAARVRAEEDAARAAADLETIAADEAKAEALRPQAAQEEALRATLIQASADARQHQSAQEALARVEASLAARQQELADLRAHAARRAQIESTRDAVAVKWQDARQQLGQLTEQMGLVMARGTAASEQIETLAQANGALCPVCEQPLTADHRTHLRARKESERTQLRAEYRDLKERKDQLDAEEAQQQEEQQRLDRELAALPTAAQISQVESAHADMQAQHAELRATVARLAAAPQRIQQLENEIAALNAPQRARDVALQSAARRPLVARALQDAHDAQAARAAQLAPLDAALAAFATLDDDSRAAQDLEEATRQPYQEYLTHQQRAQDEPARARELEAARTAEAAARAEHEAACVALEAARARYNAEEDARARQEETRLEVEAGSLKSTLQMQERDAKSLTRQLDSLLKQEKQHAQALAKREVQRHEQDVLEMMRSTIRQAGPQITQAMIRQISAYAAQWFGELTGDFTRRLNWDQSYGITLEHDGRTLDFKSLSGGEQMAAALSVRLGLLRELSTIDIAFFDEPTAHMDAERREALAKQIISVKGFRQIFVISHDDTFEHQTDNVIHIERVEGASRVVGAA